MKTPQRRRPSAHFTITRPPQHFREDAVVTEHRERTSIPWKMSVGRYLALGATLNEATAELFAKVLTGNPLA